MTLITVVNTARIAISTDSALVPAEQVQGFVDAVQTAQTLTTLLEQEKARVKAAENAARELGQKEGFAKGTRTASDQLAETLTAIHVRSEEERDRMRSQVTRTALEIVRRIASSLGEAETLAAIALEAARELIPMANVTVQVRPEMVDAVRVRLQDGAGKALAVEPDETLEPGQCRLRGADGLTVLAGLETQLRNLERLSRRSNGEEKEVAA